MIISNDVKRINRSTGNELRIIFLENIGSKHFSKFWTLMARIIIVTF